MTEHELNYALNLLDDLKRDCFFNVKNRKAIDAIKASVHMGVKRKPVRATVTIDTCPACGKALSWRGYPCQCGQMIDW